MSTLALAVRDSGAMLRRDFTHSKRNLMMTISGIATPIFMMLLFVGVFGGAVGSGGGVDYIDYLAPGIIIMSAGTASAATAVKICQDMAEGIIDRFRTMDIARSSVLIGQVVGSVIRTVVSSVLVVAVALLLGFSPSASFGDWLAALGIFTLLTFSLTWLAVAFGLKAKTPAGANSLTLIVQFLPFISSAFVNPATMSAPVRWFAENQPFNPAIETIRALLTGGHAGTDAWLAIAWSVAITAVGYLWARKQYNSPRAK
ncbi:ABC transporter permease [Kibdelosporangium phytohabitans]|uniref:Transport permease protein n=1 Tax=Kibdelosporangium phytohabitans TaxID=860235 RepID=A0A0N9IFF6_9PSEU|nr:ABC transporter permease [Kibdelosporangium phytohabitans]ALG13540.1 ABC transporter permease [Kibdelosporangium phytohabitans]MBE1465398.1 ABC-2 type transport system permease protein [Kibdelosporangium phytohabitans]